MALISKDEIDANRQNLHKEQQILENIADRVSDLVPFVSGYLSTVHKDLGQLLIVFCLSRERGKKPRVDVITMNSSNAKSRVMRVEKHFDIRHSDTDDLGNDVPLNRNRIKDLVLRNLTVDVPQSITEACTSALGHGCSPFRPSLEAKADLANEFIYLACQRETRGNLEGIQAASRNADLRDLLEKALSIK
ncbi:MAG TPA: hypothetical protein PLX54_08095 [Candidatus Fermentibacter daniensis]|nr:hypothetical protein [Candidatus Fermentibacter daniensis]HOR07107.1 hypothetical protein [Candidatus Fermentibacter daniensis]HPK52315.1 hypothetical protein [Candidatus Fermentibacter daniensis]